MGMVESHVCPFVHWRTMAHWWAVCQARSSTSINPWQFNSYNDPVSRKQSCIASTKLGLKHLLMIALVYWNNHGRPLINCRKWRRISLCLLTVFESMPTTSSVRMKCFWLLPWVSGTSMRPCHKHCPTASAIDTSYESHRCSQFERLIQELTFKYEYKPLLLNENTLLSTTSCHRA